MYKYCPDTRYKPQMYCQVEPLAFQNVFLDRTLQNLCFSCVFTISKVFYHSHTYKYKFKAAIVMFARHLGKSVLQHAFSSKSTILEPPCNTTQFRKRIEHLELNSLSVSLLSFYLLRWVKNGYLSSAYGLPIIGTSDPHASKDLTNLFHSV